MSRNEGAALAIARMSDVQTLVRDRRIQWEGRVGRWRRGASAPQPPSMYADSVALCRKMQCVMDVVPVVEGDVLSGVVPTYYAKSVAGRAVGESFDALKRLMFRDKLPGGHASVIAGWCAAVMSMEPVALRVADAARVRDPGFRYTFNPDPLGGGRRCFSLKRMIPTAERTSRFIQSLLVVPGFSGRSVQLRRATSVVIHESIVAARMLSYAALHAADRLDSTELAWRVASAARDLWHGVTRAVRGFLPHAGDLDRAVAVGWGFAAAIAVAAADRLVGACGRVTGIDARIDWRVMDLVDESLS